MSSLDFPEGDVSQLKVEVVGVQVGLCRRPITINGLLPPMRWGHEVTIHQSHVHVSSDCPCPLRPHRQITTRGSHWHNWLVLPFSSPLFISSPLPSSLPRTNPIPMLSSPSSSPTQPELWVHSPLIQPPVLSPLRNNSHRARTAACRKIAPLPLGCWTLCIQQRQPSSLSLPRIKSSSMRVEKGFQLLCVWPSSKWNFYCCSAIEGSDEWLIASVLVSPCHYADLPLVFLFVHCGVAWVDCDSWR